MLLIKAFCDPAVWAVIGPLLKEYVLPHLFLLIVHVLLFAFLGLVIAIFTLIYLKKKKMLVRRNKYYHWAVKLYYPLLILGALYFSIQLGLLTGLRTTLIKETHHIVESTYNEISQETFKTETEKQEFLKTAQIAIKALQEDGNINASLINDYIKTNKIGFPAMDALKNKAASYIFEKYKDEIFSAVIYGFLFATNKQIHMTEHLSYNDIHEGISFFLALDPKDCPKLEASIQKALSLKLQTLIDGYYKSFALTLSLLWLLLTLVPFIEYSLYKIFTKRTY